MADLPRANARRALKLLAVTVAMVVVVGVVIGLLVDALVVAVPAALVAGTGLALWARRRATDLVVRSTGAQPAQEPDHPRLFNLVAGLCLSSGVPVPELYVVDDAGRNVLVAGTSPRRAVVVVTTGLLAALDRVQLEGVIAHQLARIRQGDTAPTTLLAVLGRLTRWVVRTPLAAERFVAADLEACQMTRYPPGLIGAMEAVAAGSSVSSARTAATAHLWFAAAGHDLNADPHPPLDERIALLREL